MQLKQKLKKLQQRLPKDKLPEGVTVKVKEVKAGTTPTTAEVTETGKPKPATVVVEYTDDKGNVIGTKEVEVPVTVVGSTPKSVVVFEGTTPEKDKVKESVTIATRWNSWRTNNITRNSWKSWSYRCNSRSPSNLFRNERT